MTSVAIIGTGFGGIAAAVPLVQAGVTDVFLQAVPDGERGDTRNWPASTLTFRRLRLEDVEPAPAPAGGLALS